MTCRKSGSRAARCGHQQIAELRKVILLSRHAKRILKDVSDTRDSSPVCTAHGQRFVSQTRWASAMLSNHHAQLHRSDHGARWGQGLNCGRGAECPR